MKKNPYEAVEVRLKDLDGLLKQKSARLGNFKQQLDQSLDRVFNAIDALGCRLIIKDPYSGYRQLPENLENLAQLLDRIALTLEDSEDEVLKQSFVQVSKNLRSAKSELPKPLFGALTQLQRFFEKPIEVEVTEASFETVKQNCLGLLREAFVLVSEDGTIAVESDKILQETLFGLASALQKGGDSITTRQLKQRLNLHATVLEHFATSMIVPGNSSNLSI